MKLRLKTGDPGTPNSKPSPSELAAANEFARNMALRKGLASGENTYVGNQLPKFVDALGNPVTAHNAPLPPRTITNINQIPTYVKELQWDDQRNVPYYVDEKTGDMQYVHPDIFYSTRFNPKRGMSAEMLLAKK